MAGGEVRRTFGSAGLTVGLGNSIRLDEVAIMRPYSVSG